jgi:hypothetical protein
VEILPPVLSINTLEALKLLILSAMNWDATWSLERERFVVVKFVASTVSA